MLKKITCFECGHKDENEYEYSINPNYYIFENNKLNENEINERIDEMVKEKDLNLKKWICIDCVQKFQEKYEKLFEKQKKEIDVFEKGLKNLILDLQDEKLKEILKIDYNKLLEDNKKGEEELNELKEEEEKKKKELESLKQQFLELENQNNHLSKLSEDLDFMKEKEKIINDTSSLKELYKIDVENCKLNNNSLLIIKDQVKNFNKGMRDLINLTEIIASKLNFLTENYTLFSNPVGSYILNRKEKKIYLLYLLNEKESSKKIFSNGMNYYNEYLKELITYINVTFNIGDLSFGTTVGYSINGFINLDTFTNNMNDVIVFLNSILTHQKLKNYFN